MAVRASTLRKLADAKLSGEQMALVLSILADEAEEDEARKASQRDRTRRARAKQKGSVALQSPHGNRDDTHGGVTRVEDKTLTTVIEPQKKDISPRAALAVVLDDDRAKAVVDHRQRIRKPLTGHAASLLAKKFSKCPDPNAAADAMVGNGWQGFEPEWMNRNQPRGSPHQRPPTAADLAADLLRQMEQPDASTASEIEGHSTSLVRFPRVASG